MPDVPLILASASPRRRELLARIRPDFQVAVSSADETGDPNLAPREICLRNARVKARAVSRSYPEALILAADTEVALDGRVFGKPASLDEARCFLRQLAGRTHEVITAICLRRDASDLERLATDTTRVTFQPLTDGQIDAYLAEVHALDKAGAYAVQERGEWIIESIEGSLTNVVGLPLALLRRELAALPAHLRPRIFQGPSSETQSRS